MSESMRKVSLTGFTRRGDRVRCGECARKWSPTWKRVTREEAALYVAEGRKIGRGSVADIARAVYRCDKCGATPSDAFIQEVEKWRAG